MASSTNIWSVTLEASADLSTKQYLAIVIDSSGDAAVSGAAIAILGTLQNKPDAAGKASTIQVLGRSKVISGAAYTAGDELEIDSAGKFVTQSAGITVAFALETAGAADEIRSVVLK